MLIVGGLTLYISGAELMRGIGDIMRTNFIIRHADIFNAGLVIDRFRAHVIDALIAMAPILVVATVIAIAAPLALGGWSFSGKALMPKFERLDPIKGVKRVFGPKGDRQSKRLNSSHDQISYDD